MSPDHKSMLNEILVKYTKMKIVSIQDGLIPQPNTVYVLPPNHQVTILHNRLHITRNAERDVLSLPIDTFFQSFAKDHKDKSIGIILSGTGSDGCLGVRAIYNEGGLVMVQDPDSAEFDGMPRAAIATNSVNYILQPARMPMHLIKYTKKRAESNSIENLVASNHKIFQEILNLIQSKSGINFADYKISTVVRRIEKRMGMNRIFTLKDYLVFLKESEVELQILNRELLIGVTSFFRDPEAYNIMKKQVIPEIFKNREQNGPIRIWSCACSSGEEPYSLAILFREYMDKNKIDCPIKIFATDVDKTALEDALFGYYPKDKTNDVPMQYLKKYFVPYSEGYKVAESIRKMVVFSYHDILHNPAFVNIDLLSCRNFVIYLNNYPQKRVLSTLHFSVKENGFLFMGKSESLGDVADSFAIVNQKWKIYQCKNKDIGKYMPELIIVPMDKKLAVKYENDNVNVYKASEVEKLDMSESFYDLLLEDYLPPSVIVDETYKIVQTFKDVNPYIQIKPGKLTFNLSKLIHSELSGVVMNIIQKVLKDKEKVEYKNVQFVEKDELYTINITGRYWGNKATKTNYALITFDKIESVPDSLFSEDIDIKNIDNLSLIKQYKKQTESLAQRLKLTEETLQSTVDKLEISNEELQTSNEELIVSNEELQSSNEELQSVNEELHTVNAEHQIKIDELTSLNNDVDNLLNNINNVGILFLDSSLNIRKITKFSTKIINIRQSDIGRPISHITYNFNYPGFMDLFEEVIKTKTLKEIEVNDKNYNWYLIKIIPYITKTNTVDGILVAIIDITSRKNNEAEVSREKELLIRVLEKSATGNAIIDKEGKFLYVNKEFEKVFKQKSSKLLASPAFEYSNKSGKDIPIKNQLFNIIKTKKKFIKNYPLMIKLPNGKTKNLLIDGTPIFDEAGEVEGVILNITESSRELAKR